MYASFADTNKAGRHRLIEIETVKNGWIVAYYPKPENPEELLKRQQELQKEMLEKRVESEKEEFARRLKEQAASMQIAGEAMMRAKESWQDDEDVNDKFKKIDELAEKMAEMHPVKAQDPYGFLGPFVSFPSREPVSMIFTDKNDLFKFLAECI